MNNTLYHFFTEDHHRIEQLFDNATEDINDTEMDYYHSFRTQLLKHIKMEEKILFPAAQKANNDIPLPLAGVLRLHHGALTALLVVPPCQEVTKALRYILEKHDLLEEQPGGMYDLCEKLTSGETNELLAQLKNVTEVPVQPYNISPYALEVAKRAVQRAGFDFDEIVALEK